MSHSFSPEPDSSDRRSDESVRSPFAEVAGRFANWLAGGEPTDADGDVDLDPTRNGARRAGPTTRVFRSPGTMSAPAGGTRSATALADPLTDHDLSEELEGEPEPASRFPLAPLGYNRTAVDEHLSRLEREVAELRALRQPAMSITEELEWIGEQTASILVVAHDKAHETTLRAQEQAERTVAEAAASAAAIVESARRRLGELDAETDQVWHERERLLDDVRIVSVALADLADEAAERFPAADGAAAGADEPPPTPDPQATRPFSAQDVADATGGSTAAAAFSAPDADRSQEPDRPEPPDADRSQEPDRPEPPEAGGGDRDPDGPMSD
jgi:hypothetical protein